MIEILKPSKSSTSMMNTIHQAKEVFTNGSKWCVYSHFDKNDNVELYVIDALKRIKDTGFRILFISTSQSINEVDLIELKKLVSVVAIRENIGYDFGSYKLGIQFLFENQITPKQLLITNDSVFGPIFDLNSIIKKSRNSDLFGLTDSVDFAYHLQSYFIIYNSNVVKSNHFRNFWNSIKLLDSNTPNFKKIIIEEYEVGGTQFFIKNGFKVRAAFGIDTIIKRKIALFLSQIESSKTIAGFQIDKFSIGYNPTHNHWENLIKIGFPYIKRELLTINPTNTPTEKWLEIIEDSKSYNPGLIIDALINFNGNKDFMYTSQPSHLIAEKMDKDGVVKLDLMPQFKRFLKYHKIPKTKKFIFDSQFYLSINLDVKAEIDKGAKINPITHFIDYGHAENRPFKLQPAKLHNGFKS
jgi:lipopolysaccharide biosynthesis protein